MNKLKNLVTGVDFSGQSRIALTEAARIAEWNGAKLRLVHVVEAQTVRDLARHERRDVEELRAELTDGSRSALQEWGADLGLAGRASERVVFGHATDEIVKQIKEVNAGLLVAGVRGTANEAAGAGLQATRLVRSAPCNVLLVDDRHVGPFKRIIAGIDFSPTSREVVEQALKIACQDDCEVMFVHIYVAPWKDLHLPLGFNYSSSFRTEHLTDLELSLREFVGGVDGVRASFHLHHHQKHGRGISEFAREQGGDLLVLGTRGDFNIRYLLLGSTAEYLLREQPCSVLAIHPQRP